MRDHIQKRCVCADVLIYKYIAGKKKKQLI